MKINIENAQQFVDLFVLVVDESHSLITDSLENAVKFAERACNDIDLMMSVLSEVCRNVGSFWNNSSECLRHLKDMKDKFESGVLNFKDLTNQEIFNHGESENEKSFLQSCKEIESFVTIRSFWQAVCGVETKEFFEMQMAKQSTCDLKTKVILAFLATNCTSIFKREMENVFHGDLSLLQLYKLFWREHLIISDLHKELCHIKKIFGYGERCCERENMIKRCLEMDILSNKIDAFYKLKTAMHLELDKECETCLEHLKEIQKCPQNCEYSMLKTNSLIIRIESDIVNFSEETMYVLNQFSESQNLVSFLREIENEDIRNLIDSVEGECFDQFLPLVSNLVEVKGLLLPVLDLPEKTETRKFIKTFEQSLEKTNMQQAVSKISQCSQELESLKSFYKTFANKSEKTKERITNILEGGCFHFKSAGEDSRMELHCKDGTKLSASELSDMRSRVLLLQNKFENVYLPNASCSLTQSFSDFLRKADDAAEILEIYKQLKMFGYPSLFESVDEKIEMGALEEKKNSLLKTCEKWRNDLNEFRHEYYCMKYIKSEHLPLLFNHIERNADEKKQNKLVIESILHFLHPRLELRIQSRDNFSAGSRGYLEMVVHGLEENFSSLALNAQPFPKSKKTHLFQNTLYKSLYFVCIDRRSGMGLNFLLGLFRTKCNTVPLPSQVVLCCENTSWDEIYLLLLRCKDDANNSGQCFCLAFLELLPTEHQRKLVDEIKKNDWNNNSLALIYRGRSTDSIPTFFKDYEIFVKPLDKREMENLLQTMSPDVQVFTSDFPGLGKTEEIYEWAASRGKGVKSLHVSGAYKKSQLVKCLMKLNLTSYEILLIEIGLTDKPWELDIFFFELLMLKYVSHSSFAFALPDTPIAIEITNCPNQLIPNNLPFLMCFSRRHLRWQNYDNYKCQLVQNSPVQVVCTYLGKFEDMDFDTDIDLSQTPMLPDDRCRSILRKFFPPFPGINFTLVNVFVSVFSNQLKKFSASTYFKNENLISMIGEENKDSVKKIIIQSQMQFSKEFATKSLASCRKVQQRTVEKWFTSSVKSAVTDLAEHTETLTKWNESNHLVVVFHGQDSQTVSALYRTRENVPGAIKNMFESQIKRNMPDYSTMESGKILDVITKIVRTKLNSLSKEEIKGLVQNYVFTSDNMLKMMMIALRIQATIPVIVMGETGCGKTSLIKRLAKICDVQVLNFSVHAGIRKKDIFDFVNRANKKAISDRSKDVWVFLDEINTSEDIGLISDIICHRKLQGDSLAPNLCFVAACNPYRLRDPHRKSTFGLMGKRVEDSLSDLAYRVHPLPEMILDFVWDYGSLADFEEEQYIRSMVETEIFQPHANVLALLLATSQKFVRKEEGSACTVSLRDVSRCIQLIKWFEKDFLPKQHKQLSEVEVYCRSFILGLTMCYACRFSNSEDRLKYRKKLLAVFQEQSNKFQISSEQEIAECVTREQNAILKHMVIPEGIAVNEALRENVFVTLICIINRIPLFIVGKPGCSKSLSMQLIRNNMKGKESEHIFFRNYPRLFYSSFQGSESSTSEGIIKVFERAKKIKQQDTDALSLVILDEIGLAEISRFNPLKVLHSLLEPEGKDRPDISVVGISNWSLDPAKMNRAIYLSRPDMNLDELLKTGIAIMKSDKIENIDESTLQTAAKAYLEYTKRQEIKNFHGLRDYYSFIKYISKKLKNSLEENLSDRRRKEHILLTGLLRNFGGQQMNNNALKENFLDKLSLCSLSMCETEELIKDNILDSEGRHLMLIVDGDSAFGSLENIVRDTGKDCTIIVGSKFADDQNEDYNYRILNRIILCMEQPQVLILKDLDDIYGSLYDLLNQNYTTVQKKKHCRIALGPYSNPTCEVNDEFKCIVMIDTANISRTDPPFLNRFEKQRFLLSDFLKPHNWKVAKSLKRFVCDFSFYKTDNKSCFEDPFPIDNDEMFASLIVLVEQALGNNFSTATVFFYAIIELIWILKPDYIVRADISAAYEKSPKFVNFLLALYMCLPVHNGLGDYLKYMCSVNENVVENQYDKDIHYKNQMLSYIPDEMKEIMDAYYDQMEYENLTHDKDEEHYEEKMQKETMSTVLSEKCENLDNCVDSSDANLEENVFMNNREEFSIKHVLIQRLQNQKSDEFGGKFVIFTNSTIHCRIQEAVANLDCSFHKLAEYKSEKTLTKDVERFFETSQFNIFVLQCEMKSDYCNILLAKSVLEKSKRRFGIKWKNKNICMVIHLSRSSCAKQIFNKINLLSGWTLATLDSIETPPLSLPKIYMRSVRDLLGQDFDALIRRELPWAFSRLQFQGSLDLIIDVSELLKSKTAVCFFSEQVQVWVKKHSNTENPMDWQHTAAFDKHLLETSTTLTGTLESHLSGWIQEPLAKSLYYVLDKGLIYCLLHLEKLEPDFKKLFHEGFECKEVYDIDTLPPPTGPGCYVINLGSPMKVPFSKVMFDKMNDYKTDILNRVRKAFIIPGYFKVTPNEKLNEIMSAIAVSYSYLMKKDCQVFDVLTIACLQDLEDDFCQWASSKIRCHLSGEEKISLMKWILSHFVESSMFSDVSTFILALNVWTLTFFQNILGIFHLVEFGNSEKGSKHDLLNQLFNSRKKITLVEKMTNIVDSICRDMLCKCEELQLTEMDTWQERVYKFMTIIAEIGVLPNSTKTLKFFNDFISVVFLPLQCNATTLHTFASTVSHCEWTLTKLEVFQSLWHHLKSMVSVDPLVKQQIICSFIAKCNGPCSNVSLEIESINVEVLKYIGNGEMFDEHLQFYGQCLKLQLCDYIQNPENNFFLTLLENKECTSAPFDVFLSEVEKILDLGPSPFSILFVSTLEEEVFNKIISVEKIMKDETSKPLIQIMHLAKNALQSHRKGFQFYIAIAYLRKFLSVMSSLIVSRSAIKPLLYSAINELCCRETENRQENEMRTYLINCLKRNADEVHFINMTSNLSEEMHFFKTCDMLSITEKVSCSVLSFNLARYCEIGDILLLQQSDDISKEQEFIGRIKYGNKRSVAALLCVLHSRVFYKEMYSATSDSDQRFAKSVLTTDFLDDEEEIRLLIKYLVCQDVRNGNIFKQTIVQCENVGSTALKTFLLHLISLILIKKSGKGLSVLYRAAIKSEKPCSKTHKADHFTSFEIRNCACRHRIITKEEKKCPWCFLEKANEPSTAVKQPLKKEPFSKLVREMLIEAALVTTCLFQDLVEVESEEINRRENSLKMKWQNLRKYLQVNDSEQCQLLIIFLEHVEDIFLDECFSESDWNTKYDTELRKVFSDRYFSLRTDDIRHSELLNSISQNTSNISSELNKVDKKLSMFDIAEETSVHNLYFNLCISQFDEKYHCLRMILENLELFQFPHYIDGVLQWHRLLVTKCRYSLRIAECSYMTVESFMKQHEKETIFQELKISFKIFSDTWGKLMKYIPRLEHITAKLPCVENITEKSLMGLCIMRDKSSVVFQVLQALCSVQNDLLDKALEICVLYENTALGFLQLGHKKAAIAAVPVIDLQKQHIIECLSGENFNILFSQCMCSGETRRIEYDFRKIEMEWAFKLFHNKFHILSGDIMFMEFKDDLYEPCVKLLKKVSALIPQKRVVFTIETEIKDKLKANQPQISKLLTVIGTTIALICETKTKENQQKIVEFTENLASQHLIDLSCLRSYTNLDLTLENIVPFYTILEEVNGEIYFRSLNNNFREAIQDSTKQQILSVIKRNITLVQECTSAMHIFLHRYLYIRKNDINPKHPILDYINNAALWKNVIPKDLLKVFPRELLIEHSYEFLKILEDEMKVKYCFLTIFS